MLDSRYAMWLGWGPDLIFFYNDAYAQMTLGPKHPWALGRPAREVWSEIWADIGPRADSVMQTGRATWDEGLLLFLERQGFAEETYHTFSYSPVPDDAGRVGGLLCVVTEDTERTIGERRLRTLRDLAGRTSDDAGSASNACASAARTLAENPRDVAFALIYLLDEHNQRLTLCGHTGARAHTTFAPQVVSLQAPDSPWPFAQVAAERTDLRIEGLLDRFGELPEDAWPRDTRAAVVLPLERSGQTQLAGFMVVGLSPWRPYDDSYRSFLKLTAAHIARAIANARAVEEERAKAEALAEIDRAKTAFFSNVSHEFRTPLTLMLGPLEDALAEADLPARARAQLVVAQRNSVRLLKLVNTLLDFSRIEAGRTKAAYAPVDLSTLTADLASVFRSAIERAGLRLIVDCPPLARPVYVDREMWEKIVFNLLSNALKFTFDGSIEVSLRSSGGMVELAVRDEGTGIPADELPHLFERFHRVQGARGRSVEGSGIGLALVQELVKLHGGTVRATSRLGHGSKFVVSIPFAKEHLPAAQVQDAPADAGLLPTGGQAQAYVEEALSWLSPDASTDLGRPTPIASGQAVCILLADDNADMRNYARRLLLQNGYDVVSVGDGAQALEAARRRVPDLIVTDVMMPNLDGFGLLHAVRSDERLKSVPVVMLSARAGEEARVEGIQAGADDYLVKPFAGAELLARIAARLEIARVRGASEAAVRQSEERYRAFVTQSAEAIWRFEVDPPVSTALTSTEQIDYVYQHAYLAECNDAMARMYGYQSANEIVGARLGDFLPRSDPNNVAYLNAFIEAGYRLADAESHEVDREGKPRVFLNNLTGIVEDGLLKRAWGTQRDITERHQLVAQLRESEEKFFLLFQKSAFGAVLARLPDGVFLDVNEAFVRMFGYTREEAIGRTSLELGINPDAKAHARMLAELDQRGFAYDLELVLYTKAREERVILQNITVVELAGQKYVLATIQDVTERKRAERALLEADRRKDEFLATLAHELRNPLAPLRSGLQLMRLASHQPEAIEQARAMMERQLGHMVRLIDDLMDVSRISRGKIELRKERVSLGAVLHQAIEATRPMIDQAGHELSVSTPSEPILVHADVTRMTQVFANLLNNAVKFTDRGGQITVTVSQEDGRAVVSVRDTGIGIPAEVLPTIFNIFTQVDSSPERTRGGLGIGLSLVRSLVELHGGQAEARSGGYGAGSEFIIRLPVSQMTEESAPRIDGADPSAARRRVLVVDDNHDAADSMALVMRAMGHDAHSVYSALEALAYGQRYEPAAIVLDIGMPKVNGYEAARRIREQPWGKKVRLIALTGWGQDQDRKRSQEAGFDAHMVKPADPSELQRVLDALLAPGTSPN